MVIMVIVMFTRLLFMFSAKYLLTDSHLAYFIC